ncbi:LysR family transcriptional regulator (plasmid) [Sphingobium sp. LB126]|uniref:LysR substrate-binding domain-containing protein n=1 Tax=Sphingobium sp. LB126 TaxID=1983755 RepID=UPI000C204F30|nr:LysR substrate-binding domain-containing protein [Sphingobium sp. LB126]PJG45053.1 LysR family transcriptional regulator [Sphingobium sp. LB126]
MNLPVDFTDLRLFINISEANSVTGGAERTFLSAPAASVRIKHIEESMGVKLLDRSSQGVTLTSSGQAFLHHARLMIEQMASLRSDLRDYAEGIKGHIRVVASPPAILDRFPHILKTYLERHPEIRVDLIELVASNCVRAVSDGTAEIGILGAPIRTEDLQVLPYLDDRFVLVTPTDHPLAARGEVYFADALEYELVGCAEHTVIQEFMRQAACALNRRLRIRVRAGSYDTLCHMVESNLGIGVLSERAGRYHVRGRNLRIIPLADKTAAREIIICVRNLEVLPSHTRDMIDLLLDESRKAD